jgi:hypothetical protein
MKKKIVYVPLDASPPALAQRFVGEGRIEEASGEVVAPLRATLAVTGRS